MHRVAIIGGGLAGSEAALQLGDHDVAVTIFEMRPQVQGAAHSTDRFAELVCSNSLKSTDPTTAAGLLKAELDLMGSKLLAIARRNSVDAGAALAVDRDRFAAAVTHRIENHPNIEVKREEFIYSDDHRFDAVVIAAGPLASDALAESIKPLVGDSLQFFDAAAPIVCAETIDYEKAFFASRYGKGSGNDYLNCPLDEHDYARFIDALLEAGCVKKHAFERKELFSACQPVEEIARSGRDALRFGAMKPVGIDTPKTGRWAHALVQLRSEDENRKAYNLVGFQTNLTWAEQKRVFRIIPGLENAEFLRYGVMHRNTFVDAPNVCNTDFSLKANPRIWLAGQITGTEGYTEAICSGLYVALNVLACLKEEELFRLPKTTVSGALFHYATNPGTKNYQPMHVNYGIIDPLEKPIRNKRQRYEGYSSRSLRDLRSYLESREQVGKP
jgi:methylenetetrahydrofolate--tRNA-(uracil-5-)-methyltransferase